MKKVVPPERLCLCANGIADEESYSQTNGKKEARYDGVSAKIVC